ncbi:toprim domain-containing protein [Actinomadura barringtoniae]|uniref:Toprim domain-containing protein n=1 Tax=Actinomadura barringtoniae TaxID=1427535 RepID=A0A939PD90_9ACTN|nr:toprim domain-containing protein [Actinomadura barringtoniae]MBO2447124.1 toprim domain-containing protein [Actinomadura barringtoniae]
MRASDPAEQQRVTIVLQAIADQEVGRLLSGDLPWTQWLVNAARHDQFSFINTLLIPAQRPDATEVRSYQDWKKDGRQVARGETGIRILTQQGPRTVFDQSQTTGPAIEKAPSPEPASVWGRLRSLAADLGLYVDHGERWTYTGRPGRLLRIPVDLEAAEAARLLAHQLAHVLHRGDHPDPDEPGAETACHGVRRVVADSTAHLVLDHLGLSLPPPAMPAVTSWAGADERAMPVEAITAVGDRVLGATAQIRGRLAKPPPPTRTRSTQQAAGVARASTNTGEQPAEDSTDTEGITDARPAELVSVMTSAHRIFRDASAASWVPGYLANRGFDPATVQHWEIGYAPGDGKTLIEQLRALGHADRDILGAGLARRGKNDALRPFFRDRLVLPLRAPDGTVCGFIGRRTDTAPGPKYLNSPDTPLFRKSELLFGLYEMRDALAQGARPVLVEGPFDAIAINTSEPSYAAVAPCGTTITTAQLNLLAARAQLDAAGLALALDGDDAGQIAAVRAWPTLAQVTGPVSAVTFAKDRDPADILSYQGCVGVRKALQVEVPLADLVVDAALKKYEDHRAFPEGRLAAARAAATLIATGRAADAARQATRVATKLDLPPALVNQILIETITSDGSAPGLGADPLVLAGEDFPVPGSGASNSHMTSAVHRTTGQHHQPQQAQPRRKP